MLKRVQLAELLPLCGPGIHSISNVWIDGVHYELADDGETLIETPETDRQRAERIFLSIT